MKYPSTYKFVNAEGYDYSTAGPVINEDFVVVDDHLPSYEIDYSLSYEQKCKKYFGQNMFLENCNDPENTYFVYSCYLNLESPGKTLFWFEFAPQPKFNPVQPDNKKYKFSCMQHKARPHRVITSSWINEHFDYKDFYFSCGFNVDEEGISEHENFIGKLYPGLPIKFIEPADKNLFIANYLPDDRYYKLFYSDVSQSVFQIVTEPEFFNYGFHNTEKSNMAFLSFNIPIIHGYGACDCFKKLGFDMFEDIVNYSSQYIKDPYERTFRLLNDNKDNLINAFDIMNPSIKERLDYNYNFLASGEVNKGIMNKINDKSVIELFKEIMYNTSNKQISDYLKNIPWNN